MALTIDITDTPEEQEDVFRFRYGIYVDGLGLTPPGTDLENRRVHDALDNHSTGYTVLQDGRIVATLRLLLLSRLPDPQPLIERFAIQPALERFEPQAICITDSLLVDPAVHEGDALSLLFEAAFADALGRGVVVGYMDCSPHLLPLYERLGWRRYRRAYNDTAFGYKVPLIMVPDPDWFARVDSPLLGLVQRRPADSDAIAWFRQTYPEYRDLESAARLPSDAFFDILGSRLAQDPLHRVRLFHGLEQEEVDRFMAEAKLRRVNPGDRIVRQRDRDDTLYVLLAGLAEVTLEGHADAPVAVIGAGDCFGEIGFLTAEPRTATVTVKTEGELLVLKAALLRRMIREEPAIAAKVLLNLSQILSRRLAITTRRTAA